MSPPSERSTPTPRALPVDELAGFYRERSMAAVVFTVDARTAMGAPPNTSAEIA